MFAIVASIGTTLASVKIGDLYYNIDTKNRTAEVTYRSDGYHYFKQRIDIPSIVSYNDVNYNVTRIGDKAFKEEVLLKSVTIPNSVTRIGDDAFYGCSSLTSVTIPNSVTTIGDHAFYGNNFDSITIPSSVTWIKNGAFAHCFHLSSITLPDGITSVADSTFKKCSRLTSITIPNSVTSIGNSAFEDCSNLTEVTIGNSVSTIGKWAFIRCKKLTAVTIPNSVNYIRSGAFAQCGLTSIAIPSNVETIEHEAFTWCYSLTTVYINSNKFLSKKQSWGMRSYFDNHVKEYIIGDDVRIIGENAFHQCDSVNSITIGNNVTSIGDSAFHSCSRLTSITIPNSVTSIGKYAFVGTNLDSVTIGNSVTSIGLRAFYNCSGLASVTIPNSVTSIGWGAFSGCSGLISVTIGNSVTSIEGRAFSGCRKLRSIVIPNSVTTIGQYAFEHCGLRVICEAIVPPSISLATFNDCYLYGIHVPCESLEAYTTASGWSSYQSYMNQAIYTISVGESENGNVSVPKNPSSSCGVQVTAVPNNGYHFVSWTDGNTENPRVLDLTQDTVMTAIFAINTYNVTLTYNHDYGTVTGETGVFEHFSKITYEAIPNYGYNFVRWSDGSTANPRTITITCDTKLTAIFEPNQYRISTSCDQTQGNITGAGSYPYLSNCSLEAVSNYGYHFSQWTDGVTDNPRSFILTQDTTFAAKFAPNQYHINVSCDNNIGTIAGENGIFDYLTERTYEAIPNYGYHFVRWSDGETANPRIITITDDTELTAIFELNQYRISVSCDQAQGSITGAGSYPYKSNCTIEAVPNYGYHFNQWKDGVMDNPRSFVLTQDTTFVAEFALNQYSINVSCDNNMGIVVGENGIFDYLTERTYEAIPNYGYHFVRWSDGETANPRTITLVKDITLSAEFSINLYNVQFFGYEEVLLDQQLVEHGKGAIAPDAPIIKNYEFVGWDKDFSNVQSDLDIHAKYVKTIDGIEDICTDEITMQKVLINGQLFILRGDKTYTVQGQEVR